MKTEFTGTVFYTHSSKTDTVLMFASHIGSFGDAELKGQLYAIGNTARITFDGLAGYIDIDLKTLVQQAIQWQRENTEVEGA
jgi:hypothetical protein